MYRKSLFTLILCLFSVNALALDPFIGIRTNFLGSGSIKVSNNLGTSLDKVTKGSDLAFIGGIISTNWRFYAEFLESKLSFYGDNGVGSYALFGGDFLLPFTSNLSIFTGVNTGLMSQGYTESVGLTYTSTESVINIQAGLLFQMSSLALDISARYKALGITSNKIGDSTIKNADYFRIGVGIMYHM